MISTYTQCRYIVAEYRRDLRQTWYAAAPTGHYRKLDGSIQRDGSHGPEWTTDRSKAYEFKSYRSACFTRAKNPSAKVQPVL